MPADCCSDPAHFGCFKRTDKHWAECLPYAHMGVDAQSGQCVGTAEWLCPHAWLTPPPPATPPPPPEPPAAPGHAKVALLQTRRTVAMLSTTLVAGGGALVLIVAILVYLLCYRRRATVPHLTSVVDDDAIEMAKNGSKDDIIE